jgi:hypothetical protein
MVWVVEFYEDFATEFDALPKEVQTELSAKVSLLEEFGSMLKRPHVDTLNGSQYPNMKELRFDAADGVWRVAFAFDIKRCAILLVAGDKSGVSQKKFYKQLITKADARFTTHLAKLKKQQEEEEKEKNQDKN